MVVMQQFLMSSKIVDNVVAEDLSNYLLSRYPACFWCRAPHLKILHAPPLLKTHPLVTLLFSHSGWIHCLLTAEFGKNVIRSGCPKQIRPMATPWLPSINLPLSHMFPLPAPRSLWVAEPTTSSLLGNNLWEGEFPEKKLMFSWLPP